MKQTLSILTFFSCILFANAQSLELYYNDTKMINGDTISVNVLLDNLDQQFITVKNISSSTKSVMVKRYDILTAEGVIISFCWDACYPPETTVSPTSIDINADDICENFTADFMSSTKGRFYVLYVFYDKNNENDSAAAYIEYNCTNNAIAALQENVVLNVYPNPAKDKLKFNYTLENTDNAFLRVYTITGDIVFQQVLESGSNTISLDVNSWATGVYMYAIVKNNRNYITKKLIIAK